MPERKNFSWATDFGADAQPQAETEPTEVLPAEPAANDANGWQQYREWISKAPAPRARRAGVDPTLYSWKGYRNWSENVKRNWLPDEPEDSE